MEVSPCGAFAAHGEQIVKLRAEGDLPARAFTFPRADTAAEDQVLAAAVDGMVVGRAVLGAVTYPFAELENMEITPEWRRRGVGSALVAEAVRRAAAMGFPVIHLQTTADNPAALRLYARQGFLPARQGEMLRMVRFINYPTLARFLAEHPLACFRTDPRANDLQAPHRLSWKDPLTADSLVLGMSGGSCQFDSDGFAPGVESVEIKRSDISIRCSISGPKLVRKQEAFPIDIGFHNSGSEPLNMRSRLLLNPGFTAASGTEGRSEDAIEPGTGVRMSFPVEVTEEFDCELWKVCAYPSVPVCMEFFLSGWVFWLAHQVRIEGVGR